ncbi:hypothetical protein [Nocardia asteroides]|nr:hypothetical protein [Nocardia asteroides]UGT61731.1 hypothetical protein LTT61_32285 [Nocardia asteroides]
MSRLLAEIGALATGVLTTGLAVTLRQQLIQAESVLERWRAAADPEE